MSGGQDNTVRLWDLSTIELSDAPINFTLLQVAGLLSYAEAHQNNQPFDWKAYPEILSAMHKLPDNWQKFLGIKK